MWFTVFFPFPNPDILREDCSASSQMAATTIHIWASLWDLWLLQLNNLVLLLCLGCPWQWLTLGSVCYHQEKLSYRTLLANFQLHSLSLEFSVRSTYICSLTSPRILVSWTPNISVLSLFLLYPTKKTWCQFHHSLANTLNSFAILFCYTYMGKVNKTKPNS